MTVDPSTGVLTGTPRRGDPGISRLVVEARTPTGGVTTQSYVLALYRPAQPPDTWVPWSRVHWISESSGNATEAVNRGLNLNSVWGRIPKRLDAAAVRIVNGRIIVRLPVAVSVPAVRVISAGGDRVWGTADDGELPVRRSTVSSDGRDIIVELANALPAKLTIQIEIQTGGESYIVILEL